MRRFTMVALVVSTLAACDRFEYNSVDAAQEQATQAMLAEANAQVGMPRIVNWTERRQFKQIIELRDDPQLATYTYTIDMTGRRHFLCESLGYGLPYSVQYVNPQRTGRAWGQGGFEILPQADPNGLFMPEGLSATWVLCIPPDGGEGAAGEFDVEPLYVESEIIVSRFELPFVAENAR